MAAYKFTFIMQYLSGQGAPTDLNLKGGFSESVYRPTATPADINAFRALGNLRARLLPLRSFISGLRVQRVDPSGPGNVIAVNLPGGVGGTNQDSDIPQAALLLRVLGQDVTNVRSMRLCAIPDDNIVLGEFKPTPLYRTLLLAYLAGLQGWRFRATDLTAPDVPLVGIAANGVYTANADITTTANGFVKIKGTTSLDGTNYNGRYKVQAFTTLRTGTLFNWPGVAVTGGTITNLIPIYPQIVANATSISRVVTRKIGRPSLGYRGRRSVRRV